ncbi:GntR family transcriptional regulator [Gulosibacter faecalis]|jgi:DNA-binding GntR family transcriptional regulator|uniref:GntR family transcriptional regulator n=1 Tax=Gulosibacter faecalis TaxID=272240 RepID=A0ABW5V061_9MICO|nr:GntR family transcriptional regulator [Gulosibacter faecalis]
MTTTDRGPTMTERAVEQLRRAIVLGELEAGERYSATELGERFGMSRTPIREATQELVRLGLVTVERNRGIRVLPTSLESFVEGFEVRLMLEVPLAARAARSATQDERDAIAAAFARFVEVAETGDADATLRCDRDFHAALLEVAGNRRAVEVLTEQRNLVLKTGVGTVPNMRSTVECAEDHRAIVDAIVAGDGPAAGAAMRQHILNTADLLLRQESAGRSEFGAPDALRALEQLR